MSDAQAPGATPPVQDGGGAQPAVAYPRATQMSASAVPSTLESPKDPMLVRAEAETRIERPLDAAPPPDAEGYGGTLRDDSARDAAIREAAQLADAQAAAMHGAPNGEPSARRYGPPTLMSPTPGASGSGAPPAPRQPAESAVVDAVLPAAAFLPAGAPGDAFGSGSGAPGLHAGDGGGHAQWGAPGAHAGAFGARDPRRGAPGLHPGQLGSLAPPAYGAREGAPRSSNTALIALIVVGVVLLLGAVAVIGGGALVLRSRRAAASRATKASEAATAVETAGLPASTAVASGPTAPSTTATAAPGETAPRAPPRATGAASRAMGGTRARLSGVIAGSLEVEGVRAAVAAAMPRIDACFAANELEPPNHENAAYDLEVAASGTVTRAEPATPSGRAAKLDVCVGGALRAARMPKSPGGSRVKVILTARIADLQPAR